MMCIIPEASDGRGCRPVRARARARADRVQAFFPWEPSADWSFRMNWGRQRFGSFCGATEDPSSGPFLLTSWNLTNTSSWIDHPRITIGCYLQPFEHVTLLCTCLVAGILLTVCVYEPTERLYNGAVHLCRRHATRRAARRAERSRVRPDRSEPRGRPAALVVDLELIISKRVPAELPHELKPHVSREQWAEWAARLEAASDAANPLRALAARRAPALLDAVEQRVHALLMGRTVDDGAKWAKRARAGVVACGRVVEALVYRPLLLPTALACGLHPLYAYHWYQTRAVVALISKELQPLGGHVAHFPGLVRFDFGRRDGRSGSAARRRVDGVASVGCWVVLVWCWVWFVELQRGAWFVAHQ